MVFGLDIHLPDCVIIGSSKLLSLFRHSRESGIRSKSSSPIHNICMTLISWIPDQVRNDADDSVYFSNFDTVCLVVIQVITLFYSP